VTMRLVHIGKRPFTFNMLSARVSCLRLIITLLDPGTQAWYEPDEFTEFKGPK
jgi:hypothetical protein